MFGIAIQAISSFVEEISGSLEKLIVAKRAASFYSVGFVNAALSIVFYVAYILSGQGVFVLNPASLPSFAVFAVLGMIQSYASMKSTVDASRSTYNFLRTPTMPLLLLVDLTLGYSVTPRQMVGIAIIFVALTALFMNHGIEKQGAWLTLFTAVNAVAIISIYKWHITVWNSVAAEQIISHCFIAAGFLFGAVVIARENPLRVLRTSAGVAQTVSYAFGSFLEGFAYRFGPASVILAAKRSFSVLWSIAAGQRVFHEKHIALKLVVCAFMAAGIALIAGA